MIHSARDSRIPSSRAVRKREIRPCRTRFEHRLASAPCLCASNPRSMPETVPPPAIAASLHASRVADSRISPSSGNFSMAFLTVGYHPSYKNQTTLAAAHAATMNCTNRSRPCRARANAATPRGVSGSHAVGNNSEAGIILSEFNLQVVGGIYTELRIPTAICPAFRQAAADPAATMAFRAAACG